MIRPAWFFFISLAFIGPLSINSDRNVEVTPDGPLLDQTCSWENREGCDDGTFQNKHLERLLMRIDDVETSFDVYVLPDVATFYNATPGSIKGLETKFSGLFGKFINMSNKKIRIFWDPARSGAAPSYIADIEPFHAAGTATYPRHKFFASELHDESKVLQKWTIDSRNSLYKFDPYGSVRNARKVLSPEELELYKLQHRNLLFNEEYQRHTGRQWIALFERKHRPRFPIWPADYFGQTHLVSTEATHIISPPPDEIAKLRMNMYGGTAEEREQLEPYQSQEPLVMNMTVISCAPRAFEIRNFLSDEEVQHMLELSTGMKLSASTTRASNSGKESLVGTRTSKNTWIARNQSPIVDVIYRRAADLLKIDEAFMRYRYDEEDYLLPESISPITERLQLVHYADGQQYTPHHDFAIPDLHDGQSSRFATLLLYLNEGMTGGETSFPRWLNGNTTEILKVTPEVGKAVLFYSQLPDGNYDERSQHAALPVTEGEKWLANLWVWDPFQR